MATSLGMFKRVKNLFDPYVRAKILKNLVVARFPIVAGEALGYFEAAYAAYYVHPCEAFYFLGYDLC